MKMAQNSEEFNNSKAISEYVSCVQAVTSQYTADESLT